ncbi:MULTISPECIES: glycoside hydrolase family 99-like domain-containing protein [unclassified Cryobacterium]|uniref:glycoside hydrolase family 99-like domain-containing protein n=1 Tax=unclassified Cryobacterium TaxID=2649013 RepID=UPI002AB425A3|nr:MULTISPECIES: glycoside hydrolase family 99-like domain-containing protein [unclassified Cryobacterium]MDY7542780.1 glycoside hydrolase family 99-like domain-containing protein [Cryobacterium sp. 5B3]MEA9998296.1 glycoside hydrolase family 99-like domain-containing protein [Cryobacterium sp. RTS3]MEB0264847.1 glycoside hydrolase family 99-like domain-containing protein [Cryobacterium sp. 10I5]MEB0273990.1 glycoside hydrolase family 99-like domain-containing protein [Cryobacterium sp. 5B3]
MGLAHTPAAHSRIAVVMHVYYTDLVDQILAELQHIPVPFDLIVTNASGQELDLDTSHLPLLSHLTLLDVDNKGRDILPLISVVNADLLEAYELVLKIHTKKSEWRQGHAELGGDGAGWRDGFIEGLLGSRSNVERILSEFAEDPSLGILTTDGNVLGAEFWGGDQEIVAQILLRLQLELADRRLRFAAGSIYWVRGFVLQGLRALNLDADDFDEELGQIDGTTAHAVERIIGIVTEEAGYSLRTLGDLAVEDQRAWKHFEADVERTPRARVVPFYLPQYHAFPENESWWGAGFTEWSNVAAATPVFFGHNQPFLPADLGFYDLSNDIVRSKQYDLARLAGIEGFMYYYYWFAGKKLMDTPVENLLATTDNAPFCIMWANENWTRRWDGSADNVLIAQDYDAVPATQFIHDVLPLITDPRYIRVDNKPLISVYRVTQIPDHANVLAYWRKVALEAGLDGLTIVTVDVGRSMDGIDDNLADNGLDAFLEFAPHNRQWTAQPREHLGVEPRFEGNILSYAAMASDSELQLRKPLDDHRYPGVMVNFDNTARRQWQPDLWYGSNPYTFRRWFNSAVSAVSERERDHRIVFVNAWNEWAEGTVLEPSQRFGRTYLLAVRDVLFR